MKAKIKLRSVIGEKTAGDWNVLFGVDPEGFYIFVISSPGRKTGVFAFRPTRKEEAFSIFSEIEASTIDQLIEEMDGAPVAKPPSPEDN